MVFDYRKNLDLVVKAYEKRYPDRFLGIRFENLKSDPESETKRMTKFLGVDFESSMLDDKNWMVYFGNDWIPWKNEKVSSFHKDGTHLNPVGRCRDIITPEELFLCEWLGRDVMERFNIKREGPPIVDQKVFDNAIEMLMGSELLRDAFMKWCATGRGVEKYPVDPFDPKNWSSDI